MFKFRVILRIDKRFRVKYIPNLVSKYPCLQELLDKIDMFKDRMEENIITEL